MPLIPGLPTQGKAPESVLPLCNGNGGSAHQLLQSAEHDVQFLDGDLSSGKSEDEPRFLPQRGKRSASPDTAFGQPGSCTGRAIRQNNRHHRSPVTGSQGQSLTVTAFPKMLGDLSQLFYTLGFLYQQFEHRPCRSSQWR